MTTTMKFELKHIKSTVEVQADSTLKEVDGFRYPWGGPGMVFPDLDAWVSTMIAAAENGPWGVALHNWKLSYCPPNAAERSSVVWVPSKKHYMEVRRGDKTTFTEAERRYWLSWEDWATGVCCDKRLAAAVPVVAAEAEAPAIQVKEEPAAAAEMPAAVPVVEAVAVAAPFDAEKFKANFKAMTDWINSQSGLYQVTGLVQLCTWLGRCVPKCNPARAWIKENPAWRYTARAITQALSLEANHPLSTAAVDKLLDVF